MINDSVDILLYTTREAFRLGFTGHEFHIKEIISGIFDEERIVFPSYLHFHKLTFPLCMYTSVL